MKQFIVDKQWDEISSEQQLFIKAELRCTVLRQMSIGQMIEFLGDDVYLLNNTTKSWWVSVWRKDEDNEKIRCSTELCDVLWKAVKYKLKQGEKT